LLQVRALDIVIIRFIHSLVAVFPGRIIRMVAISNTKSLDLKQTFVRHVSHEIRSFVNLSFQLIYNHHFMFCFSSPLNVVHAGLEILRSELPISTSETVLELIDDIHSASETAIEILNDLLHYEHIDSGKLLDPMQII